jgi:hypothetical protein
MALSPEGNEFFSALSHHPGENPVNLLPKVDPWSGAT